ncbi:hypothetical protein BDR03DRAFT_441619 [Suillus americanus]|nr:hypothetical protein BDR03DRAFT_441619 [Suillus americanus]
MLLWRIPCAARVKLLFMPHDHERTSYAFLLASAPKDALIFPNLRSLTWCDWRVTSIPAPSLFLHTLETLYLDISEAPFRQAIIPDFYITAPHLKALEFAGDVLTTPSEIELLFLSYPEGLTELSFTCCNVPSSLLDVIAAWPRL